MKKTGVIFILAIILFTSCATQRESFTSIKSWSYPPGQLDSTLGFSFVENVLGKVNYNQKEQWAHNKNIHIISVRLINNTSEPIHGTQISFQINGKKVETVDNKWLAKKIRKRSFPQMLVFLPFYLIEDAIFHSYDDEYDPYNIYEDFHVTNAIANEVDQERIESNNSLMLELIDNELYRKVLWPNTPVYSIVGIKYEGDISDLKATVSEAKFSIIDK